MVVLALTAFVGLALVTFFIVLFISYAAEAEASSTRRCCPSRMKRPGDVANRQL